MMILQLETALNVVDKAAQQNDRWLFLGLLVAVLIGFVLITKYLVNSIAIKDAAHAAERVALAIEVKSERETARADNKAEREIAKAERKTDQVEFFRMLTELEGEIKKQSDAIASNTEILRRHDADMRTAHSLEIGTMVKHELERMGYAFPPGLAVKDAKG